MQRGTSLGAKRPEADGGNDMAPHMPAANSWRWQPAEDLEAQRAVESLTRPSAKEAAPDPAAGRVPRLQLVQQDSASATAGTPRDGGGVDARDPFGAASAGVAVVRDPLG